MSSNSLILNFFDPLLIFSKICSHNLLSIQFKFKFLFKIKNFKLIFLGQFWQLRSLTLVEKLSIKNNSGLLPKTNSGLSVLKVGVSRPPAGSCFQKSEIKILILKNVKFSRKINKITLILQLRRNFMIHSNLLILTPYITSVDITDYRIITKNIITKEYRDDIFLNVSIKNHL